MAVITDAERKKQRNRELKREYYAKTKKEGCAEQRMVSQRREEELALRNDKTPILPQTPFSALFTDFFIDRNPKK